MNYREGGHQSNGGYDLYGKHESNSKHESKIKLPPDLERFLRERASQSAEARLYLNVLGNGVRDVTRSGLSELRGIIGSKERTAHLSEKDKAIIINNVTQGLKGTEEPKVTKEPKKPQTEGSNNGVGKSQQPNSTIKPTLKTVSGPIISGTKLEIPQEVTYKGLNLSILDFRQYANRFPGEASVKNNNPAGLTWNPNFAKSLSSRGIKFEKGTARPAREGGYYFGFPNMEEGMKAYDFLWERKLISMGSRTFGDLVKKWAVDTRSYKSQFGDIWNIKLIDLPPKIIAEIKKKQIKIESPGMGILLEEAYANHSNTSKYSSYS